MKHLGTVGLRIQSKYQRHLPQKLAHPLKRITTPYESGHSVPHVEEELIVSSEEELGQLAEEIDSGKLLEKRIRRKSSTRDSDVSLKDHSSQSSKSQAKLLASAQIENVGKDDSDTTSSYTSSYLSSSSSESDFDLELDRSKKEVSKEEDDDEPDWTLVEIFNLVNDFQEFLDSFRNEDEVDYEKNEDRPRMNPEEVIKIMKSERLGDLNVKKISVSVVKEPPPELIKSHTVTKYTKLNDRLTYKNLTGKSGEPDIVVKKPQHTKRKPVVSKHVKFQLRSYGSCVSCHHYLLCTVWGVVFEACSLEAKGAWYSTRQSRNSKVS